MHQCSLTASLNPHAKWLPLQRLGRPGHPNWRVTDQKCGVRIIITVIRFQPCSVSKGRHSHVAPICFGVCLRLSIRRADRRIVEGRTWKVEVGFECHVNFCLHVLWVRASRVPIPTLAGTCQTTLSCTSPSLKSVPRHLSMLS